MFYYILFTLNITLSKKCVVKFSCPSDCRRYFVVASSFSAFNYFQNCVKFFYSKLYQVYVWLTISNFFCTSITVFWMIYQKKFEMLFFLRKSFFWLIVFVFVLLMLLIRLNLFSVCDVNRHCFFSAEFLGLWIWPCMDSNCSFLYTLL